MPSSSRRKRTSLFGRKKVDTRNRHRISRDQRPIALLSARKFLVLCGAVLLLRMLFALVMQRQHIATVDYQIGVNLAEGKGFSYEGTGLTTLRAPLYPLFLAFCHWCYSFVEYDPGSDQRLAVLIQHVLAGLVPLWLARLGEQWESPRPGQLVGLAFLFSPSYFLYPSTLEPANLFVPFAIFWLLQLTHLERVKRRTTGELMTVGVLGGILVLLLPLVIVPMIAMSVWWLRRTRWSGWLMPLAAFLTVLPWTIRNYVVFHQLIPVQASTWRSVYRGFGEGNPLPTATRERLQALEKTVSDVKREPEYREAVGTLLRTHPGVYGAKILQRIATFWGVPRSDPYDKAFYILPIRWLTVPLLNVASVLGLWFLWQRRRMLASALFAVLVYFTLVYALTEVESIRVKLDIEWLQFFLLAGLAETLLSYRDKARKQRAAEATAPVAETSGSLPPA